MTRRLKNSAQKSEKLFRWCKSLDSWESPCDKIMMQINFYTLGISLWTYAKFSENYLLILKLSTLFFQFTISLCSCSLGPLMSVVFTVLVKIIRIIKKSAAVKKACYESKYFSSSNQKINVSEYYKLVRPTSAKYLKWKYFINVTIYFHNYHNSKCAQIDPRYRLRGPYTKGTVRKRQLRLLDGTFITI